MITPILLIVCALLLFVPIAVRGSEHHHGKFILFPPDVHKLWINLGSHIDPPVSDDPHTYTLAIEPVLETAKAIKKHPRLIIITVAISDFIGFAKFNVYNQAGVSSSLDEANHNTTVWGPGGTKSWAYNPVEYPPLHIVPVMTLKALIKSLPRNITIEFLKTDLQGHDFKAIKSAGNSLIGIHKIMVECYCHGFHAFALDVDNSFESHNAHITSMGFTLERDPCKHPAETEVDAVWLKK